VGEEKLVARDAVVALESPAGAPGFDAEAGIHEGGLSRLGQRRLDDAQHLPPQGRAPLHRRLESVAVDHPGDPHDLNDVFERRIWRTRIEGGRVYEAPPTDRPKLDRVAPACRMTEMRPDLTK